MVYLRVMENMNIYALNGCLTVEETKIPSNLIDEYLTNLVLIYPDGRQFVLLTCESASEACELLFDVGDKIKEGKTYIEISEDPDVPRGFAVE